MRADDSNLEIHDQNIGQHRVSFVTDNEVLRWVIIDGAHFTDDEFYELAQRFQEFRPEYNEGVEYGPEH